MPLSEVAAVREKLAAPLEVITGDADLISGAIESAHIASTSNSDILWIR